MYLSKFAIKKKKLLTNQNGYKLSHKNKNGYKLRRRYRMIG